MLTPRVTAVILVVAIWATAGLVFLTGRGSDARSGIPTAEGTPSPAEPRYLDVKLDPAGRPYDVAFKKGFEGRVVRRPLAVLHAPSGRVRFTGGETAPGEPGDPQIVLAERAGRRYPVHAIWLDATKRGVDEIVGVVIVERDAPVARWRELNPYAYGTDAGTGAIATVETPMDMDTFEELNRVFMSELVDKGRQSFTADVDGSPGVDTIVFANGYGDGGFPSVAGYDASGRRVAIVLWSTVAPWRLSFPEGTPPPQVTERENELAACLAGKRTVEGWSGCRAQ